MVASKTGSFKVVSSLILVALGLVAVGEAVKQNVTTVDGHAVAMVGACNVSDMQVSCWDPSGTRNPRLTERIKAHLINSPQQGISLRFRKKNRLIVASYQKNSPSDYFNLQCQYLGEYTNSNDRFEDNSINYFLIWIAAEESDSTAKLTSSYTVQLAKDVSIKLKKGETCDIAGHKFEIINISKAPTSDQNFGFGSQGPHWYIHYRITPPFPTEEGWNSMYALLNADGDIASDADKEGKLLAQKPGFNNGNYPGSLISSANQSNYLITRADPDQVASMLINVNKNVTVPLTPVKLDPAR